MSGLAQLLASRRHPASGVKQEGLKIANHLNGFTFSEKTIEMVEACLDYEINAIDTALMKALQKKNWGDNSG